MGGNRDRGCCVGSSVSNQTVFFSTASTVAACPRRPRLPHTPIVLADALLDSKPFPAFSMAAAKRKADKQPANGPVAKKLNPNTKPTDKAKTGPSKHGQENTQTSKKAKGISFYLNLRRKTHSCFLQCRLCRPIVLLKPANVPVRPEGSKVVSHMPH